MIKRCLLILFIEIFSLSISAKTLKVYSVTGNVSKKDNSSWISLSKANPVSENDIIKINPASLLRILDTSKHQVYTFSDPGEYKLYDLISKSDKETQSLMGKIAAETKKQMASNTTKSHQALGAAHRATFDEEVLEALYAILTSGFEKGENIGNLIVEKIHSEDDLFYLSFTNSSEEPMFVNLFVKCEDEPWQSIYKGSEDDFSILLPPGEALAVDYILLADEGGILVAVGFNQPFEAEELNDMFEENFEPEDVKADNVNIFFIK